MIKRFIVAGAALCAANQASAITATGSSDANALAAALAGPGFNVTSATLTTDTENGFFTGGAAGTGIDSGVVLTTGSLSCVGSANTSSGCSGSGAGASLAVNFTLDGDSLFFNYVFASEEYNAYVGSFNDFFTLTLNGPGFTDVNLAQLPNGGGVVSINNVNLDVNSAYYRNNNDEATGGTGTTGPNLNLPIEYDGLTTVLTASATGLTAGADYTLTFAISDAGDTSLDSAVFIQGGSVGNVTPPMGDVPEPATWATLMLGFGLTGGALRRGRAAAFA